MNIFCMLLYVKVLVRCWSEYIRFLLRKMTQLDNLGHLSLQLPNKIYIMAEDDLLILTLLKIPVAAIRYFSRFMAILTYLPNYLLILALDAVIFSATLTRSATAYVLSWPLRLVSLVGVVYIFGAELYYLYKLIGVEEMHWGWQALLMLVSSQIILALMRHGYLSMIQKFDPVKLKSPLEHIIELLVFLLDIITIFLVLINVALVINAAETFRYKYEKPSPNTRLAKKSRVLKNKQAQQQDVPVNKSSTTYFKHVVKCIRKSILSYIHLFYVKIFFRAFPWRYLHSINEVNAQIDNILNLTVLLTLLFLGTLLDLFFFLTLGIYCYYLHPRKMVYRKALEKEHRKYRPTLKFFIHSLIQIAELLILVFCLPFKWSHTRKVISLITDSKNNYSHHYWEEVLYVVKLTLIKIPSLICLVFLALSFYKYKRMNLILRNYQKQHEEQAQQLKEKQAQESGQGSQKDKISHHKQQYSRTKRRTEKEYVIFQCFGQLMEEFFVWIFVIPNTLIKPWNLFWLKYCITKDLCLNKGLVGVYLIKNLTDVVLFVPCLLVIFLHGIYDPLKVWSNMKEEIAMRTKNIKLLPKEKAQSHIEVFNFFSNDYSSVKHMLYLTSDQISKDIFFIPLFVLTRLSLISTMGCPHPSSSVELIENLWTQFYIRRVKKSPHYQEYVEFLEKDKAAGLVRTQRDHLQFWKFAHKSCRHRIMAQVLSKLLPKRRVQKIIANIPLERGFSCISNHYWHRHSITWALIFAFVFFVIEIIVTLVGVIVLMPLTLWRLPTFIILLKIHEYKKKMFFPILGKIYVQMFLDICQSLVRLACFVFFPRATINFYSQTAFRYHPEGINKFHQTQKIKANYLASCILGSNLLFYCQMLKVLMIKVLWIRKRDFNKTMKQQNVLLRAQIKKFLLKRQIHPTFQQLLNFDYVPSSQESRPSYDKTIDTYFNAAMEDVPYIFLSLFLLFTLPWRVFYIQKCILLLRQHRRNRTEFHALVKKISKDYYCILLYAVLLISVVKTKRVLVLIYRNFKLNFFVGYLKYSHLQELKNQLNQAVNFYRSFYILLIAVVLGPYRIKQTWKNIVTFYKQKKEAERERKKLQKIHENTVKEGKELQLLTTVGYQSLISICDYLEPQQLTHMTGVCKYLYEGIKQSQEIWEKQWNRLYAEKYPDDIVKNQAGELNYNQMCIRAYKKTQLYEGSGKIQDFYDLSMKELRTNAFETHLNIKEILRNKLPESTFNKLFKQVLNYDLREGFGPQLFWPQPDDNEEYLALLGIERRSYQPELPQQKAFAHWLILQPVQFFIVRLNRFYEANSKRRLRQLIFALTTYIMTPIVTIMAIWNLWGWFWTLDCFTGCKFVGLMYTIGFYFVFFQRYTHQYPSWTSLHPFNIIQDFFDGFTWLRRQIGAKATSAYRFINSKARATGNFVKVQVIDRIVKPIKWVWNKLVMLFQMFVEKVAIPLYRSIAKKLIALWKLTVALWRFTLDTILLIYELIVKILKGGFNLMVAIAKNISKLYSKILQNSLIFALSFGILGELIFTVIAIVAMVSPSLICYWWVWERWFIIMSTIMSMSLIATGYKHLSRVKDARSRANSHNNNSHKSRSKSAAN